MSKKVLLSQYNMSGHVGSYGLRSPKSDIGYEPVGVLACDAQQDPAIASRVQAARRLSAMGPQAGSGLCDPLQSEPTLVPINLNHGLAQPLGTKYLPVNVAYPASTSSCDVYNWSSGGVQGQLQQAQSQGSNRLWWLGL